MSKDRFYAYRSAKTGRFVTAAYAKRYPGRTVRQTIRKSRLRPPFLA